jgi:hypothetical protein
LPCAWSQAIVSAWGSSLQQDWDAGLSKPLEQSIDTFRWTGA